MGKPEERGSIEGRLESFAQSQHPPRRHNRTIILTGPSGIGKSSVAELLAKQLDDLALLVPAQAQTH